MAASQTQVGKVYGEVVTDAAIGGSSTRTTKVFQEAVTDMDSGNGYQTRVKKVWIEVITDPPKIVRRRQVSVFMG